MPISLHRHMHKMHWTSLNYIVSLYSSIYRDVLWYCPIPRNAKDVQCAWCRWSKILLLRAGSENKATEKIVCPQCIAHTFELSKKLRWLPGLYKSVVLSASHCHTAQVKSPSSWSRRQQLCLGGHAMPMDQQLQAVLWRVAPQANLDAWLLCFSDLFEIPHSSHSRI